jgi:hypothetical protein
VIEQSGEGCSELLLHPTTGQASTGSGVEEIALDYDMDAVGEIGCVDVVCELA